MPTYDGCAELRKYEEFVFKWDSWIRNKGLGESDSVELMYNALTGEALEWYLSFVAMSDYPWTAREIYQELYEYCFPSNFREELRTQLMSARQDGRPVKRFAKDLQNLAQRFSDIGHATLKRLLWDGVDPYIQVFWVEKGRSAEYDDYDTLVLYAHRAEQREAEIRRCLDSEGAKVETELSPHRDNNPDGGVTAHAVRMRQVTLQSEEQLVPIEYDEPEYLEGEPEYYSDEEPGHGNNEEELEEDIEAEGAYPQQFDDEYEEGEEEYYYSQDESESRECESQYSQGEYYEDKYEEYGEDEHQPNEYGDGEYPYLDDEEETEGEGDDYYEEEGEDKGEYYDDEAGDEDEEDGHSGEPDLNTGRNEYGQDEYYSEGPLYEDEEEY
ncbi:hypothetical protein EXIGLDRAFT_764013 [Exidia glandulosa HHB12029]|uniref:Retrotransposon gag domain-containing protein n=1 Tax=Exidia glandulosa HHB12029 TaxID=1314781 RepID=A0A165LGG0_EXIGL|nr:hypothetical protein EXIGLDRAFT_764013 [Exidia glandulosa HHB12029]